MIDYYRARFCKQYEFLIKGLNIGQSQSGSNFTAQGNQGDGFTFQATG